MTTVAEQVGAYLARLGVGHAFGVVGSGNFVVTNALREAESPSSQPGMKEVRRPWRMPTHE